MFLKLYPTNPNPRYVKMILECLQDGGTIIFPTDTIYGMGGDISNPKVLDRICQIKGIRKEKANFSFIFHDLSMLSEFTRPITNEVFKMMKRNLPGPFTFILNANNNIPRIFQSKKKTVGIRIERYKDLVDIVIDGGAGEHVASTVVDCTEDEPLIVRQGKGILE